MQQEATEGPTGFNYTTHNCNSVPEPVKKKRPPGRSCGKYTLIGVKDGKYSHHWFRCKSYTCGICGPKKIRMVRKRIAQQAVEHKLQRFLTLTLDPKKLPPDMALKDKFAYLSNTWRKMREYLLPSLLAGAQARQAAGVHHGDGVAAERHAAFAYAGGFVSGQELDLGRLGRSWAAGGSRASSSPMCIASRRTSPYRWAKYFTDELLCELPSGTRRFWCSRGLALFARINQGWRPVGAGATAD